MNRELIYLFVAILLPFCSRFAEVSVRTSASSEYFYNVDAQIPVSLAFLMVATLALRPVIRKARREGINTRSILPLRYGLFALPAIVFGAWRIDRFGSAEAFTEIKTGIGGPNALFLFLTGAAAIISLEAYFRYVKIPNQSAEPTSGGSA